jgi:hypothetical protein
MPTLRKVSEEVERERRLSLIEDQIQQVRKTCRVL